VGTKRKTKHFSKVPTYWRAVVIGLVALCFAIGAITNASERARSSPLWVIGFIVLTMSVHLMNPGITWWARKDIRECSPLEEVCEKLMLDEQRVRQYAAAQKIEPPYVIGGKPLFRIEDFDDAKSLLRPAEGPDGLLRPARSMEQPDEVLVRPAETRE